MDISMKVKFNDICEMLEKIKRTEGIINKERHLKRYIESFRTFGEEFRKTYGNESKSSFYPVLRCLIPDADTARDSYGIKITTLGNIYIKILQLPSDGSDAVKLRYRSRSGIAGDYADIVYDVLKTRASSVPSEMSLSEVHGLLDKIASDDRGSVEKVFTEFAEAASALEQKWFVRLLLKRMHLGIGEQRILAVIHPKAKDLFARCTDLEKVCIAIDSGEDKVLEEAVAPFQHIRPMLCERLDKDKLYGMMGKDDLYAETKMDGERFQLHMAESRFKYISRNGHDFTKTFGRNHTEGNLTPLVAKLLESHVKSIIIDGEMMVWDKSSQSFRVKGENFDVKHMRLDSNLRPCFVAYDLLYMNGKSYVETPYLQRIEQLNTAFKEESGILVLGKRTKICTLEHFMDIFNDALDANEEGVVIKMRKSTYVPGSRKGGWYKVKADYIEGLTSDMDLLIMGGFYNRTKTYIDSYLVGVIQVKQGNSMLHCVGKVALGLSKEERIQLNASLLPHWKKGFAAKSLRFGHVNPDVWIEPTVSVVIQIKASELAPTSSYATPYVLRFPRIEAIRRDKPWDECMTLDEFERFYQGDNGVKKINKRELQLDDITVGKKPKASPKKKSKTLTTVYCTVFNSSEIEVESCVFEDFNFCILSGLGESYTIYMFKEMVVKNGGSLVENPFPKDDRCICIVGDMTYRAEKICQTGLYNVVSCNWLIDANEQKRMHLKPRDMIAMTADMKEQLKMLFDPAGDSYTEHVDCEELQALLHEMKSGDLPVLQEHEMAALEEEIFGPNCSTNFFRNVYAYFYEDSVDEDQAIAIALAKFDFQWRGGVCPDLFSAEGEKRIKVLFADETAVDLKALEVWFLATFTKRLFKVQVVSMKWITDSNRERRRLPIEDYIIKF